MHTQARIRVYAHFSLIISVSFFMKDRGCGLADVVAGRLLSQGSASFCGFVLLLSKALLSFENGVEDFCKLVFLKRFCDTCGVRARMRGFVQCDN
jgi:hypothetical protein